MHGETMKIRVGEFNLRLTFSPKSRYTVLMLTLLTFRSATNAHKSTFSGYENVIPKINLN